LQIIGQIWKVDTFNVLNSDEKATFKLSERLQLYFIIHMYIIRDLAPIVNLIFSYGQSSGGHLIIYMYNTVHIYKYTHTHKYIHVYTHIYVYVHICMCKLCIVYGCTVYMCKKIVIIFSMTVVLAGGRRHICVDITHCM
jgi:hypothetical protein